ncbi:hypothetical protein EJ02DRAFT_333292 [Clathrospora elynae]|uniref:Myb-like domain-containing protein n=1 Tax=Clathrospora elynae TaxID=706981 RepID=A0A6A5T4Y3_9PLEO|nr:hypothetical protein EJ02DRAFT_333292 [Clathrospora elynae]
MAGSRGLRSASRRKTPTPQPPSKAPTPQPGRAPRTRGLRSASRDFEHVIDAQKPMRRSARQASVATVTDESDHQGQTTRRTKRRPAKEASGDLATVDEMDTQVALEEEAPGTPARAQSEVSMPFRSPGAASEMSGTTAISSFSMVEAEFLEPKYILKHLRKLCDSAEEFLEHLAPENGGRPEDLRHILEIQQPDSDYTDEYRDFDIELNVHLKHFKSEEQSYVHVRALHRALFGANSDAAAQSGLDLILYLTNLLVFAKQMIHSDRDAKDTWNVLRQLDNTFPGHFMPSLTFGAKPTNTGASALLKDTFDLALELRTQLAILVLERSPADSIGFNPDDVVSEIFFRSESSQALDGSVVRGWNISALGGDDASLPPEFQNRVVKRLEKLREFFPVDDASLERGELVDLQGLGSVFPWNLTILRLLHWVRLRHRELHAAIEEFGGAVAITRNVKQALEDTLAVVGQVRAPSVAQESPRMTRTSSGRERRRSSRKFDPNAPVDLRTIDALKARERDSGVNFEVNAPRQDEEEEIAQRVVEEAQDGEEEVQRVVEEAQDEEPVVEDQQDDLQPVIDDDDQQPVLGDDDQPVLGDDEQQLEEQQIEEVEAPELSGPPHNTADLLKALKAVSNPQKENRPVSIFDRQRTAQRVEFGDGFDESQPTPGPSNKNRGKQPAQPSPRKRPRPVESDSDSDSDAFETEDRGLRVPERRRNAPVTKRVRIDPVSSGIPPSHQPPPRPTQRQREQAESVSENEAPDMTEEAPPPSTSYRSQAQLAKENGIFIAPQKERKAPEKWSHAAEEAFMEYMSIYPAKYAMILQHDKDEGAELLKDRTQVNLKDKARTMAINMIKSGTGLRPGFEDIIKPSNKDGRMLLEQGYRW